MSEFQEVVKSGAKSLGQKIKKALLIALGVIVVGLALFVWISNWTYSKGTRAGYLIKITKKGVVWKTYEGELNLGGVTNDPQSGIGGNIWQFSVPKKSTYQMFTEYEGDRVKLHYRQVYKNMPWQGKTTYMVYDIEPITSARE